jgi:pyruvate carboxylase
MTVDRSNEAINILRASHSLGIKTVALYSEGDRHSSFTKRADEAFLIKTTSSIENVRKIIHMAKKHRVDAIYPSGCGPLSDYPYLALGCEENGIKFVGPPSKVLKTICNRIESNRMALYADVPYIRQKIEIKSVHEGILLSQDLGFPCMVYASYLGRLSSRIAFGESDLIYAIETSFQQVVPVDGSVLMEKFYPLKDSHVPVEVHIFGDNMGNMSADSSPIDNLPEKASEIGIIEDALKIADYVAYRNAGTVQFSVDHDGNHYFHRVVPRIHLSSLSSTKQRELVKLQIKIAAGLSLSEIGLSQD